jgi:hypothetical protein
MRSGRATIVEVPINAENVMHEFAAATEVRF